MESTVAGPSDAAPFTPMRNFVFPQEHLLINCDQTSPLHVSQSGLNRRKKSLFCPMQKMMI